MGRRYCGYRCCGGHYQRIGCDDAGTNPRLLCHLARSTLKPWTIQGSSQVWDPASRNHSDRSRHRNSCSVLSDRGCSRYDQHWDLLCLCVGLLWSPAATVHKAGSAQALSHSLDASRAYFEHNGMSVPNGWFAMGNMDPFCGMDDHWHSRVCRVWDETQQTGRTGSQQWFAVTMNQGQLVMEASPTFQKAELRKQEQR